MSDLNQLKVECEACRKCPIGGVIVDGKSSNILSNMNSKARVMVIGRNPGKIEVEQHEPFVGPSGAFFDECIEEVGMSRSDFYISNLVRCYTPDNRSPYQGEMSRCRSFLDREIELLKPILVVALGSTAFNRLTGMNGITKNHGDLIFSIRYRVFVLPLFNPSPLSMNDPDKCRMFKNGIVKLKRIMDDGEVKESRH